MAILRAVIFFYFLFLWEDSRRFVKVSLHEFLNASLFHITYDAFSQKDLHWTTTGDWWVF